MRQAKLAKIYLPYLSLVTFGDEKMALKIKYCSSKFDMD